MYDFCIVGFKCYDFLKGSDEPRYIGGIERDLVSLARVLATHYSVSFLTYAEQGDEAFTTQEGISVFPVYDPNAGINRVRILHPRATKMVSHAKQNPAKVFIHMGGGEHTWLAWLSAKACQAKFIFLAGSDSDCFVKPPFITSSIERTLYRFALKRANLVVVQTESQQRLFQSNFSYESRVLNIPSLDLGEPGVAQAPRKPDVLWVGRLSKEKRPEWLLDAAEQLPATQFHIAGRANANTEFERNILKRAKQLQNVTLHGNLNTQAITLLYRDCRYLVSTSPQEGFPRVFLEAWSTGLPVLSFFDPDDVIQRHKLGTKYQSCDELVNLLEAQLNSEWQQTSERCRHFYDTHYAFEACRPRILSLFGQFLS